MKGHKGNHRLVTVSSLFKADKKTVWDRLKRVETLQFIASPYASFIPVKGFEFSLILIDNNR